jgi:hypothetical protein
MYYLMAFGRRLGFMKREAVFTLCGLAIRDTAGWQPALHLRALALTQSF